MIQKTETCNLKPEAITLLNLSKEHVSTKLSESMINLKNKVDTKSTNRAIM